MLHVIVHMNVYYKQDVNLLVARHSIKHSDIAIFDTIIMHLIVSLLLDDRKLT